MKNVPDPLESFSEGLARLITFAAREHDTFVPHHHQEDYFGLGRWVEDLREPGLVLSAEQIRKLESVVGWTWEVQSRRAREGSQSHFDEGIGELEKFVAQNGTARVPQMIKGETTALGKWVKTMRDRYKNGEISNAEVRKLVEYPGWEWDWQLANFLDRVEQFKGFVEKNGHGRVSGDPSFIAWVRRERLKTKQNTQPPKRRKILEQIPGW